jgi:hypothetical protein
MTSESSLMTEQNETKGTEIDVSENMVNRHKSVEDQKSSPFKKYWKRRQGQIFDEEGFTTI